MVEYLKRDYFGLSNNHSIDRPYKIYHGEFSNPTSNKNIAYPVAPCSDIVYNGRNVHIVPGSYHKDGRNSTSFKSKQDIVNMGRLGKPILNEWNSSCKMNKDICKDKKCIIKSIITRNINNTYPSYLHADLDETKIKTAKEIKLEDLDKDEYKKGWSTIVFDD